MASPHPIPKISGAEAGLVVGFMGIIDFLQFLMVIIPVVDLVTFIIGWALWIVGFLALNLYFLIRVGPSYLFGKRAGKKLATTAATSVVGLFPFLDGFVPELTVQAAAMFWFIKKDHEDYAASQQRVRA